MVAPKCFIMIGFIGSGKTTLSKHIANTHNAHRLSTDDYIEQVAIEKNKSYNEVFKSTIKKAEKVFKESANTFIEKKLNVVIDRTNLTSSGRKKFIDMFKNAGYTIIAVNVKTSKERRDEVNIERSVYGRSVDDSIRNELESRYEEPIASEGFDHIMVVGLSND